MTKKIVLTACTILISALITLAQTVTPTTTPSSKSEKVENPKKTDQIKNAEEKSDGAAFSGKGKGRDKNMIDKEKKKDKKKGKKGKKGKGKGKKNANGKKQKDVNTGDGDAKEGKKSTRPQTQKPEKAPGTRKAGDRPAQGTEIKKEEQLRG